MTAAEGQREYFLGDALGSVRQLVDENGEVTLARDYQPYGETLSSSGSGTSPYGYTGEVLDPSGLIYLRARYYEPAMGRFLTRDPWQGDANMPMSYNTWLYAYANPIKYIDRSGMISQPESGTADTIVQNLFSDYGIKIKVDWGMQTDYQFSLAWPLITTCTSWNPGKWDLIELQTLEEGVHDLGNAMGGSTNFKIFIGDLEVAIVDRTCGRACFKSWGRRLEIRNNGNAPIAIDIRNSASLDKWTVVHELSHVWDETYNWNLSNGLENYTTGSTNWWGRYPSGCDVDNRLPGCNKAGYYYVGPPPAGSDNHFNKVEDFAESTTAYVYPSTAQSLAAIYFIDPVYGAYLYYADYTKTTRWAYIDGLITGTITP